MRSFDMHDVADFPVVAIGASAGGLESVRRITEALPRNCGAAVALVVHVGRQPSQLPEILNWHGKLPAAFAEEGAVLEPGRILVAPPDRHMLIEASGRIHLDDGSLVHHTRPAVDPLFASVAATYGRRVVGVVLSGRGSDGADGLRVIKQHGGLALVEDPARAAAPQMPMAAVASDDPEVLPLDQLARRISRFCAGRTIRR
jgi:two-component system chemotaxis response regulator CheB